MGPWVSVTKTSRVLTLQMKNRPQTWRAAANLLNKKSRTAEKGWPSSLGVGPGTRVLRLQMKKRPQTWRAAANLLNKKSRRADKGWPSSLGVGRGTDDSSPLKRTTLQARERLEDPIVAGRRSLKWNLKKWFGGMGWNFSDTG